MCRLCNFFVNDRNANKKLISVAYLDAAEVLLCLPGVYHGREALYNYYKAYETVLESKQLVQEPFQMDILRH